MCTCNCIAALHGVHPKQDHLDSGGAGLLILSDVLQTLLTEEIAKVESKYRDSHLS